MISSRAKGDGPRHTALFSLSGVPFKSFPFILQALKSHHGIYKYLYLYHLWWNNCNFWILNSKIIQTSLALAISKKLYIYFLIIWTWGCVKRFKFTLKANWRYRLYKINTACCSFSTLFSVCNKRCMFNLQCARLKLSLTVSHSSGDILTTG